jgi:hypothetical protein
MASVALHPQSGSRQDSTSLSFTIDGIEVEDYRLRVENETYGTELFVRDYLQAGGRCSGKFNLDLPPYSSDSVLSIFFVLEAPSEEGWETFDILPAVYLLTEKPVPLQGALQISPLFTSPSEVCSIKLTGKPLSKTVFSINDRRIAVHTNGEGEGSIHFKTSDVMTSSPIKAVVRYPVYYYDEADNFAARKFSGSYLHILPSTIATHATIDPRCDPTDPAYLAPGVTWTAPSECGSQPVSPTNGSVGPSAPPICLPNSCKEDDLTLRNLCAIHSHSMTLLNNGMVAHAYASVDSSITDRDDSLFNINQIKVKFAESSVDSRVIATQNVAIAPKAAGENFQIYVDEALFNRLADVDASSSNDVKAMFYNESMGYQCVAITARAIDEYNGEFILIADPGDITISLDGWLFCVDTVFFHENADPMPFSSDSLSLPQPTATDGTALQVINVCVASNPNYVGDENEFYLYFVAEAMVGTQSQLFFYSARYDGGGVSDTAGWYQLTSDGSNKNPKVVCDDTNTLHVYWESDRTGSNQIYYGVLGASAKSNAIMAFASVIDKYAEFNGKTNKAFEYVDLQPLVAGSSALPEYTTSQLVDGNWVIQVRSGTTSDVEETETGNHLPDLKLSYANTIDDYAMAFSRLTIQSAGDNPSDTTESPYLEYNYQVAFDFAMDIFQPSSLMAAWDGAVMTDSKLDALFETWKSSFSPVVGSEATNVPIYLKDGNKFTLGRYDGIFDRIIPLFGAYDVKDWLDNPSWTEFQIRIMKQDSNLKDYVFGLLLEKSLFKASNIQSVADFVETNDGGFFIAGEEHVVLTGRAKLVVLVKTEDTTDSVSNYFIVREFPEILDVTSSLNFTAVAGYTKISSSEVVNALDQYEGSYISRYAGMLTLLLDGIAKFSHGFISELSDSYNQFDIGFGVPYGGYYAADKMMPSKLAIFDGQHVNLYFSNIEITSPTYTHNTSLMHVPDTVKQLTKWKILDEAIVNPSGTDGYAPSYESGTDTDILTLGFRDDEVVFFTDSLNAASHPSGYDRFYEVSGIDRLSVSFLPYAIGDRLVVRSLAAEDLYDTGYVSGSTSITHDVDISLYDTIQVSVYPSIGSVAWSLSLEFKKVYEDNNFTQLPLTFDGINQSVHVEKGICNDVHVVWESNKSRYWDIYYTHSVDRLKPYRFDTQITSTESQSIMPAVAVSKNGKRMITWHDDRDGKFEIYAARSLGGYSCDEEYCKNRMAEAFSGYISECVLSESFTATAAGTYHFRIDLYTDNGLKSLYKSISSSDSADGWFIDGSALPQTGAVLTASQSVSVLYRPNNQDEIFDRVLYVDLNGISS